MKYRNTGAGVGGNRRRHGNMEGKPQGSTELGKQLREVKAFLRTGDVPCEGTGGRDHNTQCIIVLSSLSP